MPALLCVTPEVRYVGIVWRAGRWYIPVTNSHERLTSDTPSGAMSTARAHANYGESAGYAEIHIPGPPVGIPGDVPVDEY